MCDAEVYRNDNVIRAEDYCPNVEFNYEPEKLGDMWYHIVYTHTVGDDVEFGVVTGGCVCRSGYGNGRYPVKLAEVECIVVGVRVTFIEDDKNSNSGSQSDNDDHSSNINDEGDHQAPTAIFNVHDLDQRPGQLGLLRESVNRHVVRRMSVTQCSATQCEYELIQLAEELDRDGFRSLFCFQPPMFVQLVVMGEDRTDVRVILLKAWNVDGEVIVLRAGLQFLIQRLDLSDPVLARFVDKMQAKLANLDIKICVLCFSDVLCKFHSKLHKNARFDRRSFTLLVAGSVSSFRMVTEWKHNTACTVWG